jgi:hypothetical protein
MEVPQDTFLEIIHAEWNKTLIQRDNLNVVHSKIDRIVLTLDPFVDLLLRKLNWGSRFL